MRRLIYLLLLVLFVSVSATCVNASTDCERWYIAYRSELAHARSLQRIAAAKRRAKLYAQRKLAGYIPPKPKLVLAKDPRMTRKQTLHHFELACGVLPEDSVDGPVIAEETPAPFDEHASNDGIDLLPTGLGDMIAENDVPPYTGSSPSYPSGGGPPIYTPPFTGGITPSTPPIPPPDVPEPSSYILVLTGMAGAAGELRRRFKS
jgi:PEP-CTERM motif